MSQDDFPETLPECRKVYGWDHRGVQFPSRFDGFCELLDRFALPLFLVGIVAVLLIYPRTGTGAASPDRTKRAVETPMNR